MRAPIFKLFGLGTALVLALAAGNSSSQVSWAQFCQSWSKTFGSIGMNPGRSVQQTIDGGYIVVGTRGAYKDGKDAYADVWLIKTDAYGNLQWDRIFGRSGPYPEYGESVQQTRDGGYTLLGLGSRGWAWLIKTDANGNAQWDRTLNIVMGLSDRPFQQTSDGGYIVVGNRGSPLLLLKTDMNGNVQWERAFGGGISDIGRAVQQTTDGGYIIVGETSKLGSTDIWLLKTDAGGNLQWERVFGGGSSDWGNSVQQTGDGGYIIVGETDSYGAGVGSDVWLIKTDTWGNKQWDKTFGSFPNDGGYSVQQTTDGGYILVGYTISYSAGNLWDVWLIKTDAYGNMQWSKTFGSSDTGDKGYSVRQTRDGGYIIVGEMVYYYMGQESGSSILLIKYCH